MIKMLLEQLYGLIMCGVCFSVVAMFVGGIINLCLDKSTAFKSFTNKIMGTEIFDDAE